MKEKLGLAFLFFLYTKLWHISVKRLIFDKAMKWNSHHVKTGTLYNKAEEYSASRMFYLDPLLGEAPGSPNSPVTAHREEFKWASILCKHKMQI